MDAQTGFTARAPAGVETAGYQDRLRHLAAELEPHYATAQELIVAVVRRAILDGILDGNTRLGQRELAAVFGTSRIPVREAFHVLESEGLLTSEPYRGFRITSLDADAVEEVYEMRMALEGLAVRLAIPLLTDEDLAELRRLTRDIEAAVDPNERLDRCERFYLRLYSVTGRPRLVETIRRLRQEVARTFRSRVIQHSPAHHDAFFAAVLDGDPESAAELLADQYRKVSALLRRYLRNPVALD